MEIVTLLLAAVALVLSLCSFFFTLTAVCFGGLGNGERHGRREAVRQRYAGPEDKDQAEQARQDAEKSRSMDEGFENLMRYSVEERSGRGGFRE